MRTMKILIAVKTILFAVISVTGETNTSSDVVNNIQEDETQIASDYWETDWVETGISEGTSPGYTEHDDAGFIVHSVGDPTKPIIYSFYLVPDAHIGDLGDPYKDYNKEGWRPDLDLRVDPATGQPEGMPDSNGSWPGRRLNNEINLINDDYDYGEGNGRFCVVLGDMYDRGEVSEQQHAMMKLDSLVCPWVPIIGNHDTWLDY